MLAGVGVGGVAGVGTGPSQYIPAAPRITPQQRQRMATAAMMTQMTTFDGRRN